MISSEHGRGSYVTVEKVEVSMRWQHRGHHQVLPLGPFAVSWKKKITSECWFLSFSAPKTIKAGICRCGDRGNRKVGKGNLLHIRVFRPLHHLELSISHGYLSCVCASKSFFLNYIVLNSKFIDELWLCLSVKHTQAHVFEHLVPVEWQCFLKLWDLRGMEL